MITVQNISLTLGERPILRDVNLDLRGGAVTALLGPNGAGKSTLFSVIAGDRRPDEGEIFFDILPVNAPNGGLNPRKLAEQRAVFPQQSEVTFGYKVREIVAMSRLLRSGSAEEDARLVKAAMERTGILEFAERDARRLSGGQQARVTLARVLAQDTPILLLDEPTAALDLHYQAEVLRICQQEATKGKTVVIVLHDLNLACAFADEIVLMKDGSVAAHGTPSDVATAGELSAIYNEPVLVMPHVRSNHPVVLLAEGRS